MLIPVVLSPSIFALPAGPVSSETGQAASICNLCVLLLQDVVENGIVLVDHEDNILQQIFHLLKSWPQNFQKKAQLLLRELKNRRRFVRVKLHENSGIKCLQNPCSVGMLVARNYERQRPVIIATGTCLTCDRQGNIVPLDTYSISEFCTERRGVLSITIQNKDWTRDKLRNKVLAPVFQHASYVRLYDRFIGQAVSQSTFRNFELALEWIFSIYISSNSAMPKRFEIYTTLERRQLESSYGKQVVTGSFERLRTTLKKKHGCSPKIVCKVNTRELSFPHGRYLQTDQITILFERGFDLLIPEEPEFLRDVTICYCRDNDAIQKILYLPDVITFSE